MFKSAPWPARVCIGRKLVSGAGIRDQMQTFYCKTQLSSVQYTPVLKLLLNSCNSFQMCKNIKLKFTDKSMKNRIDNGRNSLNSKKKERKPTEFGFSLTRMPFRNFSWTQHDSDTLPVQDEMRKNSWLLATSGRSSVELLTHKA